MILSVSVHVSTVRVRVRVIDGLTIIIDHIKC